MPTIKLGTLVKFDPFKGINITGFSAKIHREFVGKVVYINEPHNWFGVEYDSAGTKQRISFNFVDVGKTVRIVK